MTLRAGEKIREGNFINASEKDVTPANDEDKVPRLEDTGRLSEEFLPIPLPANAIKYDQAISWGSSTTRFDITNPAGTTFRYTWDGTGTDPGITATTVPIGRHLYINGQNFNASNKGAFVVTGSGANYFEITNASGVAENDKTLGTGAINFAYIPTPGVKWVLVKVQAAGGGSGSVNNGQAASAGGGAYSEGIIDAADLGAYELVGVGVGGPGGIGNPTYSGGTAGGNSYFGSHIVCNGGSPSVHEGSSAAGGTVSTPGNILSIPGGDGTPVIGTSSGYRLLLHGGLGHLSIPATAAISTCTDCDYYGGQSKGYGYGGGCVGQDSQPNGIGGQAGGPGFVAIIEIF